MHKAKQQLGFDPKTSYQGQVPCYSSLSMALDCAGDNDALHVFYPDVLASKAQRFVNGFDGKVVYAVKANPHPEFLMGLWQQGVVAYDVASLREVELISDLLPEAEMYFMHPVKSREAIQVAYAKGVRIFAFDHGDELKKIIQETGGAEDLTLVLRCHVQVSGAAYELSGKFGAKAGDAIGLLKQASMAAGRVGVSFHVGSQNLDVVAFEQAIEQMASLVEKSGIAIDLLDVGGGFPVAYPSMEPPALEIYFQAIRKAVMRHGFAGVDLVCEPGRALVAEAGKVLARVEMRRDQVLYLNDGTYGALFDAGMPNWPFAVTLLPHDKRAVSGDNMTAYSAFGPTCDSCDHMKGPFMLPSDLEMGDWIAFDNLGAYGQTMQSRFNGFYSTKLVAVVEA